MTSATVAWLVVFLIALALLPLALRAWRTMRTPEVHERTEDHAAKGRALADWLTEERVVRCILDARLATRVELQRTLERVDALSEADIDVLFNVLLRDRNVRRAIAHHMEVKYDLPRHAVLEALIEWSGNTAPARSPDDLLKVRH